MDTSETDSNVLSVPSASADRTPIRVAIVDDDHRLLTSLTTLLNSTAGFACVGAYSSAEVALRKLAEKPADVVLMDINLPGMNGIECVARLKACERDLQIIMLTMYEDSDQVFKSLQAGATGYLIKRLPPAKLLEAIGEVYRGGSPMSPSVARKLVRQFHSVRLRCPELQTLTRREEEILALLSKGCLYKEIGAALDISADTVRSHLRHIYEKLQVHSRTEAVVKYLQG